MIYQPFGFYKQAGETSPAPPTPQYNIPQTGSLYLYYKMDEGSGTTVNDTIGTNFAGITTGVGWTTSGYINDSLDFGTGQVDEYLIDASLNPTYTAHNTTYSLWCYPKSSTRNVYLVSPFNTSNVSNKQVLLWFPDSTTWNGFGMFGGGADQLVSTTVDPINNWYHIVGTDDGTTRTLYVNGNLRDSGTSGTNDTFTKLFIGTSNNDGGRDTFDGFIDEFGIWNTALTASEVLELYNAQSIDKKQP